MIKPLLGRMAQDVTSAEAATAHERRAARIRQLRREGWTFAGLGRQFAMDPAEVESLCAGGGGGDGNPRPVSPRPASAP